MKILVDCGSERAELESLPWDTDLLGLRCARLAQVLGEAKGASDFTPLLTAIRQQNLQYVIARPDQKEQGQITALLRAGFILLDGILSFERPAQGPTSTAAVKIRAGTATDVDAVSRLAAGSFKLSRFHRDPVLGSQKAERVHAEWARNSLLGQAANRVWIAEDEGQIAGFCSCKLAGQSGQIPLIAVEPRFSGKGFGRQLIAQALAYFAQQGVATVSIQTQTHNFPAMNLYLRSGFVPKTSSFTLRWHDGALNP